MDKRKDNGGARQGSGRPKKADEVRLIEKLDNLIDNEQVIKTLGQQVLLVIDVVNQKNRLRLTLQKDLILTLKILLILSDRRK